MHFLVSAIVFCFYIQSSTLTSQIQAFSKQKEKGVAAALKKISTQKRKPEIRLISCKTNSYVTYKYK